MPRKRKRHDCDDSVVVAEAPRGLPPAVGPAVLDRRRGPG
jgi:hypothetical protein